MKFIKKKRLFISAFLIPILIVGIYLIYMEIRFPGYFQKGENLLLADMGTQYNSLYSYIQDVLLGRASIFYSFARGLGGNMASTIGYYLGSPFNIVYIFFPKGLIPLCTFIIYLIKVGLCGSFMCFFLHKRLQVKNYSLLIFSTGYALCAYTVNYYFNNMWLDVVLFTPFVMYGINNIFEKKKIYVYTIFLALTIIANFYIAYMLCIFCLIYFIFEVIIRYSVRKDIKEIGNVFLKFIIGSLLACGVSCVMLLPAISNLSQIFRTPLNENQLKYDMRGFKNTVFNDILSKLYIGSHSKESVLSRNRPNIYFGIISLVLCYFYFFNSKFKIKEKITTFCIMLLFFLSFFAPYLNLFWHGFSFPNGYICRFSFLFIFFMIFIAARTFYNLNKIRIVPSILFIVLYLWMSKYISKQYLVFLEKSDIIISCVFVILYIILIFIISRSLKLKKIFVIIITCLSIVEIYINFSECFLTNQSLKIHINYENFYTEICPVLNDLDDDFYRVDSDYFFSLLDGMICNTNTLTTSLSTNDSRLYEALFNYGVPITYTTVRADLNKTPVLEALFRIKYVYGKDDYLDTYYIFKKKFSMMKYDYVIKNWKQKDLYLYENPYVLDLGFLVNKNYYSIKKKAKDGNVYENLNTLYKLLSGTDEDIFHLYDMTYLGDNVYEVDINNDSDYLYMAYDYDVAINWVPYDSIYINNEYVTTPTSEDVGIIKATNNYENQKINIRVGMDNYSYEPKEVDSLVVYWFDQEQFERDIAIMQSHPIKNLKINKNKVEFQVTSDNLNNLLFLSIPYDEGWQVTVDGKKTDIFEIVNGFIGIKLDSGKHTIKMKYISPHFYSGIIISIVSILLLIVYEKKPFKNK
ncbi:MAG: YfhO family protein [Bacilli bacterium]|nr:YfhO family protein [Bacilli bacterium]